jgi:hypothetical protein
VADKSSVDAVTVLRETAHSQLSAPVSASFVRKIRSFGLSYRESHPDAPIALESHAAIRSWQFHSFIYPLSDAHSIWDSVLVRSVPPRRGPVTDPPST